MSMDERFAEVYRFSLPRVVRRNPDNSRTMQLKEYVYAPLLNFSSYANMAVYAEEAKSNRTTCFLCKGQILKGSKRLVFDVQRMHSKVYYCVPCARNRIFSVLRYLGI